MTLSKSETSKSAITWGTERKAFWKIVTGCWAKCRRKKKKQSQTSQGEPSEPSEPSETLRK